MCIKRKAKEVPKEFLNKTLEEKVLQTPQVDLKSLYQRAYEELCLQQSKRDQIITLYMGMITFLVPFSISLTAIEWQHKGILFLVIAAIGALLAQIIIRYRIYKEAYWLCCQTITVLASIKQEEFKKSVIQAAYYTTMKKKVSSCMVGEGDNARLRPMKFVKKNIFSAESIHYFVLVLIDVMILGVGLFFVIPGEFLVRIAIGIASAVGLFLILTVEYFYQCVKVYRVLIDGKDDSFNATFSKAWFLHFYADDEEDDKKKEEQKEKEPAGAC